MVAVTGATGFIGTNLCYKLLELGFQVRVLVRDPAKALEISRAGCAVVQGDLENAAALRDLVADCSAVVHTAGAVRGNSPQSFTAVNVAGTSALIAAIKACPRPARLVFLSSLAAREPSLSWYSRSKHEAEEVLSREPGLDWVVLRPPPVYGPGDREMLPIFRWMARGVAVVPGSAAARLSLIHIDDLVAAILACLDSESASNQVFTASDGQPNGYDWTDLADIASVVWERRVRVWEVPKWLLDSAAYTNLAVSRIARSSPMLSPPKLRELRHPDWVVDNQLITRHTGWQAQIDLVRGLSKLEL